MAAAAAPAAPTPRLIAAVSFIDRLDRPLYFRAFPLAAPATASAAAEHDPSALELAVFAALDYIHEKTANTLSGPARPAAPGRAANSDLFLNLLVRPAPRSGWSQRVWEPRATSAGTHGRALPVAMHRDARPPISSAAARHALRAPAPPCSTRMAT